MTQSRTWDDTYIDGIIAYARSYDGSFPFMVAMREQAQDRKWVPTERQRAAIAKCRAHDQKGAA